MKAEAKEKREKRNDEFEDIFTRASFLTYSRALRHGVYLGSGRLSRVVNDVEPTSYLISPHFLPCKRLMTDTAESVGPGYWKRVSVTHLPGNTREIVGR